MRINDGDYSIVDGDYFMWKVRDFLKESFEGVSEESHMDLIDGFMLYVEENQHFDSIIYLFEKLLEEVASKGVYNGLARDFQDEITEYGIGP